MARTTGTQNDETSLSDLLDMDADTLNASGPTPAQDPLSLVRDEAEVKPEIAGIPEDAPAALKDGDRVTFHVIIDRFYILDRLLKKNESVTVVVGNGFYARTIDERTGRSWVEDIADPEAQMRRWGKVPFALGLAPDPRLDLVQIPDTLPAEYVEDFRKAVLAAADEITRNR